MGPLKREIQSTVNSDSAISCDGGISVLNHWMSLSKFVNTHLSHSYQWFNVHLLDALTGVKTFLKDQYLQKKFFPNQKWQHIEESKLESLEWSHYPTRLRERNLYDRRGFPLFSISNSCATLWYTATLAEVKSSNDWIADLYTSCQSNCNKYMYISGKCSLTLRIYKLSQKKRQCI